MTNVEIITRTAIAENIFTQEQINKFFELGQTLPLFTYAEWKKLGYQVRKGEKACMKAGIWMPNKKKTKDDEDSIMKGFYMKTASFFRPEQVDKITVGA